jgi:Putative adhesin
VVALPPRAALVYDGVSAELLASGLIGPQEYKTVSGDLVLADAAGPIRISSVSGDVSLRGVGPVALRSSTVSGDISAFAPVLERVRLVTVSGDIELEGDLAESGEHRMETVSGDLSLGVVGGLTLEVRGLSTDVDVSLPHRSEGSRDRRRYVIADGRAAAVFSSMSGDVSVGPARRFGADQVRPPAPPAPPAPPRPPMSESEQLAILRALEAGEIDIEEATRRLAGEHDGG